MVGLILVPVGPVLAVWALPLFRDGHMMEVKGYNKEG